MTSRRKFLIAAAVVAVVVYCVLGAIDFFAEHEEMAE
jgi:hypothetical protein